LSTPLRASSLFSCLARETMPDQASTGFLTQTPRLFPIASNGRVSVSRPYRKFVFDIDLTYPSQGLRRGTMVSVPGRVGVSPPNHATTGVRLSPSFCLSTKLFAGWQAPIGKFGSPGKVLVSLGQKRTPPPLFIHNPDRPCRCHPTDPMKRKPLLKVS